MDTSTFKTRLNSSQPRIVQKNRSINLEPKKIKNADFFVQSIQATTGKEKTQFSEWRQSPYFELGILFQRGLRTLVYTAKFLRLLQFFQKSLQRTLKKDEQDEINRDKFHPKVLIKFF